MLERLPRNGTISRSLERHAVRPTTSPLPRFDFLTDPASHSKTLDTYGSTSGGTRNICGNAALHLGLEKDLATLHAKEAALVFSSCYIANDETRTSLLLLHLLRS